MSNYSKKDQEMLEESLNEILEEGLWDRLKARGSQAVGAVKGVGQQLKGAAQQAAGKAVGAAGNLAAKGVSAVGGQTDPSQNKLLQKGQQMQQAGQQNVQAGSAQGNNAKIDSYKNSVSAKVDSLIKDIQNDFSKLGIQIDNVQYQNFAKGMKTSINKSLDMLKQ